jgi:micrococcal nuclease
MADDAQHAHVRRPAAGRAGHPVGDDLMSAFDPSFRYAAELVRVIDGDTVVLDVDLGFGVWIRAQSFRLLGINAREKSQAGGAAARENLSRLLPAGARLVVTSVKPDKYGGRYDGALTLADGRDVSRELIVTGWAAPWDGTGAKPVPPWPRA